MRRRREVILSAGWGLALGGMFGCLVPWWLGYWQVRWSAEIALWAAVLGMVLVGLGLVPIVGAFAAFVRAGGTPIPAASPPRLVITGWYRYVRNPIYVGFLIVLLGQALIFGSTGMLGYTAVAWGIGALAVRYYEQPRLARRFGTAYAQYRNAVPAWIPRLHPWRPDRKNPV
ncbi:isoprenylcysteine carboxylmethyltransferase family protein [Microlunatus elymi]|uniref:Isoprenylcysteine carboxylmethyltransferase family protein n=1 Tax=Microlunatus elymi TaxID=2596828 RepID=A0A516Q4L7_9ACTN|nr:isoprenylcysteine carboxylmethyltransferase family protein [Microlunatus elymi]QDP98312.1 isoprenylcysteine carboxylmethyltransferase family protein [Microlunatus elymi]